MTTPYPDRPGPAVRWTASSASGGIQSVQVTRVADSVWIRNGGLPDGAMVRFSIAEWDAFLSGVRLGEFEFPEYEHPEY